MKVLTGSLRGLPLYFAKNPFLRPTADKVRKALFDTLSGALEDKKVLDLFGGTGALGIEALSNGARSVTFVEKHKIQAETIRKNCEKVKCLDRVEIVCEDALQALQDKSRSGESYDLIFADPPYGEGWLIKIFTALVNSKVLNPGAIVVLECGSREPAPKSSGQLRFIKEKVYGDSKLLFYGV